MSQENVEIVRAAYQHFRARGTFFDGFTSPDMVWDMSRYAGWVERDVYYGIEGEQEMAADWTAVWGPWEVEIDALVDAGERVIAVLCQRSRSELTGLPVVRVIAEVWTMRDGRATRMEGYSTPGGALRACGLAE